MSGSAFLALRPSPLAVADLEQWCQRLWSARLTRPSGWHVTLAFLGQLSDVDPDVVCSAVAEATWGSEPFALRLSGGGTFGNRHRVLFADLDGDVDALRGMARELRTRLDARGVWYDERPFHPHLTVSVNRMSAAEALVGREKLDSYRGPQWWVEEIGMHRGVTAGSGEQPHYPRLWTAPLGGEPERPPKLNPN